MSFWTKLKNLFKAEEAVVVKEVHVLETDAQPVIHAEEAIIKQDILPAAEKVEEVTKEELKAVLLTTLRDEKSALKNAEGGLSEDAEKAVEQVIQAAVAVMIKDGMGAL